MLYTIENNKIKLTVSDHGAEIKSLIYEGKERIHDSNPEFWGRSAPLLFPCIGTISNKQSLINGKPYALPKHGFIRDEDSVLTKHESTLLEFTFTHNENTLKMYPYEFNLVVSYEIKDNELISNVIVKNNSNEVMLYNFGLHPAFKTPITEDETFEDYEFIVQSSTKHPVIKVDLTTGTIDFRTIMREIDFTNPLPLNYDDYLNDALVFDNIDFNEMTLKHKTKNQGVTFKFPNFPMLGIWTPSPKRAPFICIEPWIGCADPTVHDGQFINKKHVQKLEAHSSHNITYSWKFF